MKILIFSVNYNSDDHLLRFVESIIESKNLCPDIEVSLHILENSKKTPTQLKELKKEIVALGMDISIHSNGSNKGYFGGLSLAQSLSAKSIDYVLYCNPDLKLTNEFFKNLDEVGKKKKGVIAPAIIGHRKHYDQNPKYLCRLSLAKMRRLRFIFSNIITFCLFTLISKFKELVFGYRQGFNVKSTISRCKIYAPHGSMFIFSDINFFKGLPSYPCFLFGEELFVAEEALKTNTTIYYEPSICVVDNRHASIRFLNCETIRSLYFTSINYILDKYYC